MRNPVYNIAKFVGLEQEQLMVHMCRPMTDNKDMVEFHTVGGSPVVLTREQFDGLVKWVNSQFDELGQVVRLVH